MNTTFSTPKGDVTIRPAMTADAESLLALRLEALTINPEAFAADVDKTQTDGVGAWEERIDEYERDQSGVIILAWHGGLLIGMTGVVRGHWPKTRHFGTLWGVYVKPLYRGLRVGEMLIGACLDWSTGHDLTVINLGVNTLNTSAIRCYTRCGFTQYGTEPRAIYYKGEYYDEFLMVRLL
jgi:ribosomal protein S18 acetylase RimI-like enzyme